jgi:hypothetical protein
MERNYLQNQTNLNKNYKGNKQFDNQRKLKQGNLETLTLNSPYVLMMDQAKITTEHTEMPKDPFIKEIQGPEYLLGATLLAAYIINKLK